jgi:hypothetical protein
LVLYELLAHEAVHPVSIATALGHREPAAGGLGARATRLWPLPRAEMSWPLSPGRARNRRNLGGLLHAFAARALAWRC